MPKTESVNPSALMTVSFADLRRETSDLMNPVKRGKSVDGKAHGKPVASVKPSSKGIDAGVLLEALRRLDPDPETADEIQGHIEDMRKARTADAE